jgi:uncharacterized membrane protein YjgN (DUF898 family)
MIGKNGINRSTNVESESKSLLLEFKGTGWEYFKIWIVNLILTVLTIGIYSAWAKVRTNRYFYCNSRLDKSGFEYHAKPITILKGRLMVVGMLLIYVFLSKVASFAGIVFAMMLFLALPWVIWRNIKFNARMTSYRHVRFAFDGPLENVYRYMLLLPLLPVLATTGIGIIVWLVTVNIEISAILILIAIAILGIYILVPSVQQLITAYTINNYRYGQSRFRTELSMTIFYKTYLSVLAWSFIFIICVGILMSVIVEVSGITIGAFSRLADGERLNPNLSKIIMIITMTYLGLILLGIWFKSYIKAKLRNHILDKTQLEHILDMHSNMTVGRLFGFYVSNFILLLATLGLAYPWVKVRNARFTLDATQVMAQGRIDRYITQQLIKQSALCDEFGDAFDADTVVEIGF